MNNKTITITMRMSEKWVETLKEIAREKAYKSNKDISYLDLIKESVNERYIKEK